MRCYICDAELIPGEGELVYNLIYYLAAAGEIARVLHTCYSLLLRAMDEEFVLTLRDEHHRLGDFPVCCMNCWEEGWHGAVRQVSIPEFK